MSFVWCFSNPVASPFGEVVGCCASETCHFAWAGKLRPDEEAVCAETSCDVVGGEASCLDVVVAVANLP